MTVTAIESTKSVQEKAAPLLYMNGQALWRAVCNAMLFASTDIRLGALNVVRFERDAEGKLQLSSTDRYRLFIEAVEHQHTSDGKEFGFSLSVAYAKQLATVLKRAGRLGTVMLVIEEDRLRVDVSGSEIVLPFHKGTFPPALRKLMPKEESTAEVSSIAFNPKSLADLGKLKFATGAAGTPAQFQFFGFNKPALIRFADGPTILQMPVRRSEPEKTAEDKAQEQKAA